MPEPIQAGNHVFPPMTFSPGPLILFLTRSNYCSSINDQDLSIINGVFAMTRFYIALTAAALLISSPLLGNMQIQGKHKGATKDGKAINCTFCHTTAKFEKPTEKRAPNMNKINSSPFCMGSGCHPVKK
jgi:hypothetical protein